MNRILIVGAGFAGMHAALSAARLRDTQGVSPDLLEITGRLLERIAKRRNHLDACTCSTTR